MCNRELFMVIFMTFFQFYKKNGEVHLSPDRFIIAGRRSALVLMVSTCGCLQGQQVSNVKYGKCTELYYSCINRVI